MKQTFLLLLLSATLCFGFTQKQTPVQTGNTVATGDNQTIIKWDSQDMNLGIIKHQVPKTVEFTFTNAGKKPLIITDVKTSCGCTVAEYPKEPIAPGKKGIIKAIYSAGSVGPFHKSLTVTANIPEVKVDLNIHGEVKADVK
ncbi:MAG: DUF1573 domain-containing protein [Bacteroidia bacterium]